MQRRWPGIKTDLVGSVALVTGSSQGIGRAIALKLAENGADVVVNARNPEAAGEVVERIRALGRRSMFKPADICEYSDVKRMVDEALEEWGKLDILVVSGAGGYPPNMLFHQTDPNLYSEFMRRKLFSRLNCARAVLDHMRQRQRGKIIMITTDAGRVPTPSESLIGAAAAGVVMATKVLAQEFARWKLHVNTICISMTQDTPGFEKAMSGEFGDMGKVFERAMKKMPFWPLTPIDIAELALFLASPDSDRITGQIFSINGGLSFPG